MQPQELTSSLRYGTERMRPLVIDDAARALAASVRAYADAHPYRPGPGVKPPGDNPEHVALINTFRVVYSLTEAGGQRFRHLSVSVPGTKWPNPAVIWTIAELFGFTGWDQQAIDKPPDGWMMELDKVNRAVVVAQELPG